MSARLSDRDAGESVPAVEIRTEYGVHVVKGRLDYVTAIGRSEEAVRAVAKRMAPLGGQAKTEVVTRTVTTSEWEVAI